MLRLESEDIKLRVTPLWGPVKCLPVPVVRSGCHFLEKWLPLPREIQIAIVEHALPHTCTVGMSRHFKLPVPVIMRML